MKSTRFDGSDLRRVLTGMVLDKTVAARISSQWVPEGLFDSDWANLIGQWCITHVKKYGEAPNGQLPTIYRSWAEATVMDEKVVGAIEQFLAAMSAEADVEDLPTSDYVLDVAGRYFEKVRMERTMTAAQNQLERGQVGQARIQFDQMRRIELGKGSHINLLKDIGPMQQALLKERKKPLVIYKQALGKFTRGAFTRGTLFSFLAPDKSGKTSWLIDFTYRALRRRNNVAYFEAGDGDQDEVLRNLMCRASRTAEFAGAYDIPQGWDKEGKLITKSTKVIEVDAITSFKELKKVAKNDDAIRVSSHSSGSLSVSDMDAEMESWDQDDDWRPDVVVLDYADLLADPAGCNDKLEALDETWKQLRRLSQDRHCLVMTATQSSATAYSDKPFLLGPEHFSGRKTKNAHVNGILGINVTSDERANQQSRINWVVQRKTRDRSGRKYVDVAGCFDLLDPAAVSR